MSLLTHLSADEQEALGPKTCAYLALPHREPLDNYINRIAMLALAERKNPDVDYRYGEGTVGWQHCGLIVLLGNVIDAHKAGLLTTGRADQYRAEARAATSASTLLRLLVTLHFETLPLLR